ncbi:MAG: hypothetical protein R2744_08525 [Bacteroidales bacterium]
MRRAFREVFGLSEEDFVIPERYASMEPSSSLQYPQNGNSAKAKFTGFGMLDNYLLNGGSSVDHLEPLIESDAKYSLDIKPLSSSGKKSCLA